jgi:uncharacterized protein YcbK (DUF882 family)
MDEDFLYMLDKARDIAGVPFVISSGYRCASHNAAVGGVPTSAHVKGLAVDIKAVGSRNRFKVVEALIVMGCNRIGIGKDFVHVDMDTDKDEQVMWLYG